MKYKKSNHFDGVHFFNPAGTKVQGLLEVFRWKMAGGKKPWPSFIANSTQPNFTNRIADGEVAITSIGHITHLIRLADFNIITDPVFSERASPVQWAGPKRVRPPATTVSELPRIDLVLISHNHYDHMDLPTLAEINKLHSPKFIVPLGNAEALASVGIENCTELDWWEAEVIGGRKVRCVPAQHWSSRTPFDRDRALWCGFVIEASGLKIYFAGDTGYGSHFSEIREQAGPLDVCILPIGAYEPRWFMKDQHMNPEDAVKAHLDLKSSLSIGTHFGTFQLTDEGIDDPVEALRLARLANGLPDEEFVAPTCGETVYFKTRQ